MKIHSFQVTRQNITDGVRCESKLCPVALALKAHYGKRYAEIEVLADRVYLFKNNGRTYAAFKPPLELANYIRNYDAGKRVVPRIFRVDTELEDGII